MKWTDGHIWVSERPVITNSAWFRYKYIMVDQKTRNRHDEKTFRICDVGAMGSLESSRYIKMEDEWDAFKVRFTVFHPIIHANQ